MPGYAFEIMYRKTSQHSNADALSRLPPPSQESIELDGMEPLFVKQIEHLLVTAMSLHEGSYAE